MSQTIETTITEALERTGVNKEYTLCRYLPSNDEGPMHHQTMRKMKKNNPEKLKELLRAFIINASSVKQLDSKPRIYRKSGKNHAFNFDESTLKKIVQMAEEKGDEELLKQLRPKRSFTAVKKEFMRTVREDKIDEGLWENYKESLLAQKKDKLDS